jgi:hypothetical protein
MINHKLLTLFEGKCWHEATDETKDETPCKNCSEWIWQNLDYSNPSIYIPFLQWFWEEKRGMWDAFLSVHPFAWDGKAIPYLFSLTDEGEPRVMVLLSEWLALPETRYAWGESKCPNEYCENGQVLEGDHHVECGVCNGTGRVKAEWAKEV